MMSISLEKLATVLACAAMLGATSMASARPYDQQRPAATRQQQQRPNTHARRHARPVYRKGGHVPGAWRGPSRVVTNWRPYHRLYEPPRGYQWVRGNNGDMLLVAIATGVIASIVANAYTN